ncbi:YncE family protein [Spirosoma sp. KUDC1026]|uniref:YncE family protein n=1 Tax=Spirosoma sp. KUDC1026 TaxID=2745947 RepID=UPI00159BD5B3|nr:DUF5074 domain-containing protein [Spirosoma sp. KUDC1026]QKZ15507.1 DUF5074 domain-containing protein [Spirosoma sp. KUDC1026]
MTGCRVTEPEVLPYESGAYVVNTGSANNGSITFIPRAGGAFEFDVFNAVNARTLGGSVQDYAEINGKGVILVDNSTAGQDKVEIVSVGTFAQLASLSAPDVENPRFVGAAGPNKAYITCRGTDSNAASYVLVVDLAARAVTKKIPVAAGAERVVAADYEAFVGNVQGGASLTVIDTEKDLVKEPGIVVGTNVNPIAVDANGKLWAYVLSTREMVRINPSSKTIETRFVVGTGNQNPVSISLSADKQTFYVVNAYFDPLVNRLRGATYRVLVTDTSLPPVPFISRVFSSIGTDPRTGVIYGGIAAPAGQFGYVLRYQPGGALIDSTVTAGTATKFVFRD